VLESATRSKPTNNPHSRRQRAPTTAARRWRAVRSISPMDRARRLIRPAQTSRQEPMIGRSVGTADRATAARTGFSSEVSTKAQTVRRAARTVAPPKTSSTSAVVRGLRALRIPNIPRSRTRPLRLLHVGRRDFGRIGRLPTTARGLVHGGPDEAPLVREKHDFATLGRVIIEMMATTSHPRCPEGAPPRRARNVRRPSL